MVRLSRIPSSGKLKKKELEWAKDCPLLEGDARTTILARLRDELPDPHDGLEAQRKIPSIVWQLLHGSGLDQAEYYRELFRFAEEVSGFPRGLIIAKPDLLKMTEIDMSLVICLYLVNEEMS